MAEEKEKTLINFKKALLRELLEKYNNHNKDPIKTIITNGKCFIDGEINDISEITKFLGYQIDHLRKYLEKQPKERGFQMNYRETKKISPEPKKTPKRSIRSFTEKDEKPKGLAQSNSEESSLWPSTDVKKEDSRHLLYLTKRLGSAEMTEILLQRFDVKDKSLAEPFNNHWESVERMFGRSPYNRRLEYSEIGTIISFIKQLSDVIEAKINHKKRKESTTGYTEFSVPKKITRQETPPTPLVENIFEEEQEEETMRSACS